MQIFNEDTFDSLVVRTPDGVTYLDPNLENADFVARYPGNLGNSLGVSVCASAGHYELNIPGVFNFNTGVNGTRSNIAIYTAADSTEYNNTFTNILKVGDILKVGNHQNKVLSINQLSATTAQVTLEKVYRGSTPLTNVSAKRLWRFSYIFQKPPVTSDAETFYLVVYDAQGLITNTPGAILEAYELSPFSDSRNKLTGLSDFYADVVRNRSRWIYFGGAFDIDDYRSELSSVVITFTDGSNNDTNALPETSNVGLDEYIDGYDLFRNPEEVSISLIIAGNALRNEWGAVLANYISQNICEVRKDCIVFASPRAESVLSNATIVGSIEDSSSKLNAVLADVQDLGSSSYMIVDNNWKQIYDKYNDNYVWVPTCADHAGAYAQVDNTQQGWVSAGGVTKGKIKNCIKLAWSPNEAERDILYKAGINPITNLPAYGSTIYGDKTLLRNDGSAFSRINVRRLFIILRTSIVKSAQNLLFEFNDEYTRRRFDSIVRPFLADVKNKNGIDDFYIEAGTTVNTPQVIQSNQFIGKILIKPKYSINFIQLDFVAVGQSVTFDEALGA